MAASVELYFDSQLAGRIRDVWDQLDAFGYGGWVREIGMEPHLSLAVFDEPVDVQTLHAVTDDFVEELATFPIELASVGVFPTEDNVVFLAPVPTERLLAQHRRVHAHFEEAGLSSRGYYRPGAWVPHCTVAAKLETNEVAPVIDHWKHAFDFSSGECTAIGVAERPPVETVDRWSLASE